jgi:hypothetical protein
MATHDGVSTCTRLQKTQIYLHKLLSILFVSVLTTAFNILSDIQSSLTANFHFEIIQVQKILAPKNFTDLARILALL